MADFLAAHPASDDTSLSDDLPDEEVLYAKVKFPWEMYFDGSLRSGGRDCLHDPRKVNDPLLVHTDFSCFKQRC